MLIRPADFPGDGDRVRMLFREYADGLGLDLGFQGFEQELAALPGKYGPPSGRLLLAWNGEALAGCVALRSVDAARCEMKRLYVRSGQRGSGLGRRLAEAIIEEARAADYQQICLDTLDSMPVAQALYRSLGFQPIEAYVFNPLPGARFLALDLTGS